jgi:DNA transposition AAA+ family ATPase
MNEQTKKAVSTLLATEVEKAGSQVKWGNRHRISGATVSNVIKGKWALIADPMWQRIAVAVRYQGQEWQVAQTNNYRAIQGWCKYAQTEGASLALSHDAGAGKTFALVQYAASHPNVFYVQCAEYWTKKLFLANIYRALGKDPDQLTAPELADGIISTLRQLDKPLVILDEVDKLRDPLLMYFIELYNKLDGLCGFFLAGAPFLAIAWEKGAKRDKRGFREIYSRIGRKFMRLNKIGRKDVQLLCNANGVTDEADINAVWNEVENDTDLRRVKREIQKLHIQRVAA